MGKQHSNVQNEILFQIQKAVERKIAMKKSFRKKLKRMLKEFTQRLLFIFLPSTIKIKEYNGNSRFGCDRLGRDVEDGLQKYIRMLKSRNLQISTVVVLGSRAKGLWKPNSDVDVTIIANNLPKERKNFVIKRLLDLKRNLILSDIPLNLCIEPSGCCSEEEFLIKLEKFDINALDAVLYGCVIYDEGFWPKVKEKYRELKEKYCLNDKLLKEILKPV